MKKVSFLSIAGILLTIVCFTLTYLEMRLFAAIAGLAAYFITLLAAKNETQKWQDWLFLTAAFAFGYSLCPAGGYACMMVLIVALCLLSTLRLQFFSFLSHTKAPWLEPLLLVVALGYYVFGNIYDGSGWISWAFPAPSIMMGAFMTVGRVGDYKLFLKHADLQYGAKVGNPAPPFSLTDQDGNTVNLSDFKGKRHVLLIFVRGDWCPTCHIMLRTYEKNKKKFAEKNILVMAIGPDPVGVNKDMVIRLGLDYKVLADEKQEAARSYGMQLHDNNPMTKYETGVPLPAAFLVDINGNVAYTTNPKISGDMLNPETIFPVVEKLNT